MFYRDKKKEKNIVINEELHTEPCNKAVWCPFKRLINGNREYVKHAKASNLTRHGEKGSSRNTIFYENGFLLKHYISTIQVTVA